MQRFCFVVFVTVVAVCFTGSGKPTAGHRKGEWGMSARGKWLLAIAFVILAPRLALAQASITGTVKDPTGAVLPGVTVEAASDALIERARTAVSDSTGQY